MDKSTLSHYGWIVIVVLILAVMLALATPFGTYVGDAVVTTARGFVGISENNLNEESIKEKGEVWKDRLENGIDGGSGGANTPSEPTQPDEPETVSMITFTLQGHTYQAEEGMTFGEWVSSEYNIDGWIVHEEIYIKNRSLQMSLELYRTYDVIENNMEYHCARWIG